MLRAKLGFSRNSDGDVSTRGHAVLEGMGRYTDKFPNPPIPLSDLKTALTDVDNSRAGALDGGKKAFARRKKCRQILIETLVTLGHYVDSVAKSDMETLLLSGFKPAGKGTPPKEIAPRGSKLTYGKSGELYVWLQAFYRLVLHYQVRYGMQGPNGELPTTWTDPITLRQARRPYLITGLTPAKIYCFQVRCFKNDETYTDWSPTATRMCK